MKSKRRYNKFVRMVRQPKRDIAYYDTNGSPMEEGEEMAGARMYVCKRIHCNRLINKPGYCTQCAIEANATQGMGWRDSPGVANQDYGGAWRGIRNNYIASHPFCYTCGGVSEEVHHISPYRISKSHAVENLQALCKRCHAKITSGARVKKPWINPNGDVVEGK